MMAEKNYEQALGVLEAERDNLRRELIGTQEMLGFVLMEIGGPVVISKDTLKKGVPAGAQINIDEDETGDAFVFYIALADEVEDGQ